jgi:hypothetical protein
MCAGLLDVPYSISGRTQKGKGGEILTFPFLHFFDFLMRLRAVPGAAR